MYMLLAAASWALLQAPAHAHPDGCRMMEVGETCRDSGGYGYGSTGEGMQLGAAVYDFEWTGQIARFSVEGSFSYDPEHVEGTIVRKEHLKSFDISFFDPEKNLMRTYEDNHLEFPEFNFNFDIEAKMILTDGALDTPTGMNVGEKTEIGTEMYKGLAFWSKPSPEKPSHIHVDDWSDEFGFPIGYSSHEEVAFFDMDVAQLIANGKVGETYLAEAATRPDEIGEQPTVTGPYMCC